MDCRRSRKFAMGFAITNWDFFRAYGECTLILTGGENASGGAVEGGGGTSPSSTDFSLNMEPLEETAICRSVLSAIRVVDLDLAVRSMVSDMLPVYDLSVLVGVFSYSSLSIKGSSRMFCMRSAISECARFRLITITPIVHSASRKASLAIPAATKLSGSFGACFTTFLKLPCFRGSSLEASLVPRSFSIIRLIDPFRRWDLVLGVGLSTATFSVGVQTVVSVTLEVLDSSGREPVALKRSVLDRRDSDARASDERDLKAKLKNVRERLWTLDLRWPLSLPNLLDTGVSSPMLLLRFDRKPNRAKKENRWLRLLLEPVLCRLVRVAIDVSRGVSADPSTHAECKAVSGRSPDSISSSSASHRTPRPSVELVRLLLCSSWEVTSIERGRRFFLGPVEIILFVFEHSSTVSRSDSQSLASLFQAMGVGPESTALPSSSSASHTRVSWDLAAEMDGSSFLPVMLSA
mmetsp:Transcript_14223/g.53431  ORF Transcript_14223/g.53431 Transcript_14223/m.53431 type:complete len:463 (+) Transcript_14223:1763-3151(+)